MKKGIYSLIGVIAIAAALVVVNYVLSLGKQRIDFTQDRQFSLSDGTRRVIANLKDPVKLKFYYTEGDETIPIQVRTFAKRVEDLLGEFRQLAGSKIEFEKINPQPDSEAEDAATVDGMEGQVGPSGEKFYMGIAVSQGELKSTIPALSADRERLLEYDLTRAISRASTKDKPVLGVMTPLMVAGNPMAAMQGNPAAAQPQVFYSELERDYKIERVGLDAESIKDEIKTLIVIHPRGISDQAQYAIDQFVLRGGRLIAFLDSHAYLDQIPGMPQFQGGTSSSLDKLFKAWGVEFDTSKIVLDLENAAGQGQRMMPTVLALDGPYINREDVATSLIPNALVPMAGSFSGKLADGLTQSVLLKSSANAQLVEGATAADKRGNEALRNFAKGGVEYPIAIKVSGRFKTAFAEGRPLKEEKKDDAKDAKDAKGDQAKKEPEKPAPPKFAADPNQLKESKEANTVVLFGDSDFLQDGAAVQIQEVFGRRIAIPVNGNLPLFQAVVEQMAGDPALINLASRSVATRPLTVVKRMEAEAQQSYLGKMKELEDNLNQTKEKLAALEKKPAPGAAPQQTAAAKEQLTPEQQQEVDNFRKKVLETRRELKDVRKELRADTEALQFWTKVMNIALMPIIVTIVGILIGLWKRRRVSQPFVKPA